MSERTGAIILAAGGSTRLGRPKQFLTFAGRTLLARSVEAAAGCSPIIVVTGRDGSRVEEALHDHAIRIVHNARWKSGIGSSIRAGLERVLELAPGLEALVILVCDQPYVTAETVTALRIARAKEQTPIVACAYGGGAGVPALFTRPLFSALRSLGDDSGAKEIIRSRGYPVATVPFPEGVCDIDTEADVIRHLRA